MHIELKSIVNNFCDSHLVLFQSCLSWSYGLTVLSLCKTINGLPNFSLPFLVLAQSCLIMALNYPHRALF